MRHLLSSKVAVVLSLVIAFAVLPAPLARADDSPSIASQVSSLVADLLAVILDSADNSAPQFIPSGVADQAPLVVEESAPQYWPGG